MSLNRLKRYVKSREEKHPNLVNISRKIYKNCASYITPSYPRIMGNEVKAVKKVLETPYWNMSSGRGLVHEGLEEEFAKYVGCKYAVAVNTGGMAIQMVLRALGIKPGDEVIHQIDTCVADPFAVINAGAIPIFADIDKSTFMLSGESVESLISDKTKAIKPVHIWGNPENMDMILKIAREYNLHVIEDCCLALGAKYKGKMVGSIGDAGVFSFGCLKPVQAGEGGMITTNSESLAKELRTIRSHQPAHLLPLTGRRCRIHL